MNNFTGNPDQDDVNNDVGLVAMVAAELCATRLKLLGVLSPETIRMSVDDAGEIVRGAREAVAGGAAEDGEPQ